MTGITSSLDHDVSRTRQHGFLRRSTEVHTSVEDIYLNDLAESSRSASSDTLRGEHGDDRAHLLPKGEDEDQQAPTRPSITNVIPRPSGMGRRLSFINDESQPPPTLASNEKVKEKQVSWKDLPNKRQLTILTLARLSEPLTQTSLQAYMFYQLKSFDPSLPDAAIAAQAGLLQGSFTVAQFFTAMLWGRAADSDWGGRKKVLLIGLFGTGVSAVGFGFSRTFWQAVVFRTAGGALNGNVGTMRTMISEIVKEKKYQSRAFLLLPMCFNIGVIIGPILGGLLADPISSYPGLFGENSFFGGKDGVWWMKHWPYAFPNLISAVFLFMASASVIFGLEETLESIRDRPDLGLRIGRYIFSLFHRIFTRRPQHHYAAVGDLEPDTPSYPNLTSSHDLEAYPSTPTTKSASTSPKKKAPFRRILTRRVLLQLLTYFLLALHVSTFQNLWATFLSTPRFNPNHPMPPSHKAQHLPFNFTGGLGLPPLSIGIAMSTLGFIGITLQLFLYPWVTHRLGTLSSYRASIFFFPLAYVLVPYLAVVPSTTVPPGPASGFLVYASIVCLLALQVLARTFALPANVILLNNCAPQGLLGTLHGVGHSVSSFARTIGPVSGGWALGRGLETGVVGAVWWGMAVVAAVGFGTSWLVSEGDEEEEEVVKEEQNAEVVERSEAEQRR
ncbi:MAG: hypothetical protein MMC33_004797 [Icmadophila ericetorum]|nr:hypothetical protein [Icmadophila ericetorum]